MMSIKPTVKVLNLFLILLLPTLSYADGEVQQPINSVQILKATAEKLRVTFDDLLRDPQAYRELALKDCAVFPEGRLYPFTLPTMGYANMAMAGEIEKAHAIKQMQKLIDISIPLTAQQLNAPGNDLMNLRSTKRQGTFLGMFNYGLSCYRMVSDDDRYTALHDHITRLLINEFMTKDGWPIDSYPTYTWYVDSLVALASIDMWDRINRKNITAGLLKKHLQWRDKFALTDQGLPKATAYQTSRGCDLSMQICLFANMQPDIAKAMYPTYIKAHWLDLKFVAGFTEWPIGDPGLPMGDVDSGPMFMGLGATATGMGIGATIAVNDQARMNILAKELGQVSTIIQTMMKLDVNDNIKKWLGDELTLEQKYISGFLYGDAALFYSVTWTKFPNRLQ
ncbi:MAG: hypothetical protein ACF8OB_16125 [Phycisphaeraceae bacterium JB051]